MDAEWGEANGNMTWADELVTANPRTPFWSGSFVVGKVQILDLPFESIKGDVAQESGSWHTPEQIAHKTMSSK